MSKFSRLGVAGTTVFSCVFGWNRAVTVFCAVSLHLFWFFSQRKQAFLFLCLDSLAFATCQLFTLNPGISEA